MGAERRHVGRARHQHADRRESFVRQLLYGQRYFERMFGQRHTVCWLPDCFGFSPALPQLLNQAGVTSFFTIKVNWSETNTMPYDLFWWEGLDGSRVLAHTFNNPVGGYNAETGARAIVETWKNYRGKYAFPESLLAFGYGDGGGGPTEEMLDRQRQFADFPAVPALRPTKVADWFAEAHAAVDDDPGLPVWVGEMYLELHRGTLTTQGRTKYLHRRAERALITAETLGSMATLLGAPLAASLEPQWRVLLRNEFHDILPGSSIREVYEEAEAELGGVVAEGDRIAADHLAAIAARVVPAGRSPGRARRQPRPLAAAAPARLPRPAAGRAGDRGWSRSQSATERFPASRRLSSSTNRRPALSRPATERWRTRSCGSRSTRTGRSPASSTSAPAARRSPGAATRSGPTSTSRATGTPGTSRTTTPTQGEEIAASAIEVVETRPAPRGDPRHPPLPRQHDRADLPALGQLRRGSRSRPTSTGTSGASC